MSSLIFYTDPEQAIVATDTLAVRPDGRPRQFTSKAVLIPHLRMVVAGLGIGGLSTRWFSRINDQMIVRGMDHLNSHTPDALRSLYSRLSRKHPIPPGTTSTIYHIGFSEETNEIHAYAYRSTNDFESERLGHGTKVKPECAVPGDYDPPFGIVDIMESQRAIQMTRPPDERIYIGGEIHVFHIEKSGTTCRRLHRFDDADDVEEQIYHTFHEE